MSTITRGLSALRIATLLCAAAPLSAQSSAPRNHCWRGQPAPACNTFVITEIGYYASLLSTSVTIPPAPGYPNPERQRVAFTNHGTFEIGVMHNRGPSSAVGATLFLGGDGHGIRYGARARYRRWLDSEGQSLDLSSGIIAGSLPQTGLTAILSSDAALNFSDYGAVVAGVDVAHTHGRPHAALFGGARLGSKPAVIATGAVMVGAMLVYAALSRMFANE